MNPDRASTPFRVPVLAKTPFQRCSGSAAATFVDPPTGRVDLKAAPQLCFDVQWSNLATRRGVTLL
jgi:hypothetical protein